MKALIDGDILRYEIGFAAETGWRAITGEDNVIPPFDYVEDLLLQRIVSILATTGSDSYTLYLTEGRTFRFDIAVTKPYKGQRPEHKPWHFKNLTAYMTGVLPCEVVKGIEADDAMAMACTSSPESNIVCTRDKDLRQVPGLSYSWELGHQPSFGPQLITPIGELSLSKDRKSLKGTGYAFFAGQLLVGDRADNIPGCEGVGPVAAYDILSQRLKESEKDKDEYRANWLFSGVEGEYGRLGLRNLEEQAKLLWIVRRLTNDGQPELWRKGLYV